MNEVLISKLLQLMPLWAIIIIGLMFVAMKFYYTRFAKLEERVDDLSKFQDDVEELKQDVSTLDVKVNTLDGKVNALDGKVNTLDRKVNTLGGKMEALTGRVDRMGDVLEEIAKWIIKEDKNNSRIIQIKQQSL